MKGSWAASIGLLLSIASAHGDAAGDLQAKAKDAASRNDFAAQAEALHEIVAHYPSTRNIDDIRIQAGDAYLHSGDFTKAIAELERLTTPATKPEFRGAALFLTGIAQFSQAHKLTEKAAGLVFYRQAEETLSQLIVLIERAPLAQNLAFLEDAMYYRALAAFSQEKLEVAIADMTALLAKFGTSLQKPDYLLLLGSIYAVQAGVGIAAKEPEATVRAGAKKAIEALDQVVADPNAKVQANEAEMRKAEVLYLVAQLDLPDTAGYAQALDAFRLVHRKEDMVAIQQQRIDQLRARAQAQVQAGDTAAVNANSRLLDREVNRLADLKAGPDPILQALIRMAECYISMKQSDEARTILHRLAAAALNPEQEQEVGFQTIYSYVLGRHAEKADAALTDFQKKHPNDPQADFISVEIAGELMQRKDYEGALAQAQRSLRDYPPGRGKHAGEAVQIESQALTRLGRNAEAKKAIDDFVAANPHSPAALQLLVAQGEVQAAQGDLDGALASFKKVKENNAAGPYQSAAAAYYINTLNRLNRYDEVIAESREFAAKYPADKAIPSVEVIGAIALDKKKQPGAIPALQAVAKKFADNVETGSYALYYVAEIYQRENKIPEMMRAVADLRAAFPTAYALISQLTDGVAAVLIKEKKFEEAAAAYLPLVDVPLRETAAGAQNKIGAIWLAAAKAAGSYQSLQTDEARAASEKRLHGAEEAYLATLRNFPDDVAAVGDAFKGLVDAALQRRTWGLLKDADLEGYLGKLGADLSTPAIQTRLELAKAGLVFVMKNGREQFPAALDRFTKALAAAPVLELTLQEADQYGQLLIAAKDYPKALEVYQTLLAGAKPGDQMRLAEAYYGLAAAYLAQGDLAHAKENFTKMHGLAGGAAWSPHALDAQVGMARIDEQSSNPADLAVAKDAYSAIMRSPQAGAPLQAQAMLGYGRILEKTGHAVKAAGQADIEFATHYYEQVNLFYGSATPELSAQGLYLAGQAYAKANDAAAAAKAYAALRATYAKTAPDWVAKAPAP